MALFGKKLWAYALEQGLWKKRKKKDIKLEDLWKIS